MFELPNQSEIFTTGAKHFGLINSKTRDKNYAHSDHIYETDHIFKVKHLTYNKKKKKKRKKFEEDNSLFEERIKMGSFLNLVD